MFGGLNSNFARVRPMIRTETPQSLGVVLRQDRQMPRVSRGQRRQFCFSFFGCDTLCASTNEMKRDGTIGIIHEVLQGGARTGPPLHGQIRQPEIQTSPEAHPPPDPQTQMVPRMIAAAIRIAKGG